MIAPLRSTGKKQFASQMELPAGKYDRAWLLKYLGTGIIWFTNSVTLWTST